MPDALLRVLRVACACIAIPESAFSISWRSSELSFRAAPPDSQGPFVSTGEFGKEKGHGPLARRHFGSGDLQWWRLKEGEMPHTCELCGKDYAPDKTKSGERFCSEKCATDYDLVEYLKSRQEGDGTITRQSSVKVVPDPRL